jgi:predicted metal-dependent hydrolase
MPRRRSLEHVKVRATLERLRDGEPRRRCDEPPHPELLKAIHEFNAGQFFEQHETLELIWRAEPDEIRSLYQGILHVGVAFHHLLNGNHHGAVTKLGTGVAMLEHFEPTCTGVDVSRLVAEARTARERLLELGEERLDDFDRSLIPRVHLVKPAQQGAVTTS